MGRLGVRFFTKATRMLKMTWAVVAADGLSKRDVFRLPDPFAVITVDAEQTHTTSVIKKTLNPYWNESFDMYVLPAFIPLSTTLSACIATSRTRP